ncbi:MAG TPA: carbohydrate kinase [Dermatophilaceae bacterium]|nr:carbohydrate kinase [Dermatophilaceae bacterium]
MQTTPDPTTTATTLVVGEALIDVVCSPDGSVVEHTGGSPANVAVGLARLGHPTMLATRVGRDPRGDRIRSALSAEGVGLTPRSDSPGRTPTATATVDASGAASYDFDLRWDVDAGLDLTGVGHLHTGSIAATLDPGGPAVREIVRRAHHQATVSYDPNARPSLMGSPAQVLSAIEELIGLSDVVKASDEDAFWLLGGASPDAAAHRWAALGPRLVVITRGRSGALALIGGEVQQFAAPAAAVVDTVGAGDSFMSGLMSGLLDAGFLGGPAARERLRRARLADIRPAVQRALRCAAVTVSRPGADPPRRQELTSA